MIRIFKTIFSLVVVLVCSVSDGFGKDINFNSLTPKDGLSHFSVLTLYEDERNLIWVGTREGLNVYNGSSFDVYKVDKNIGQGIKSNYIKGVTGNKNGIIYVWNTFGIVEYDMKKDIFTPLYSGEVSTIWFSDKLYIAVGNNLLVFNESTRNFEVFFAFEDKRINISAISSDGNDILIGTIDDGLFSLHDQSILTKSINSISVISIYKGLKGKIWIGTAENGLYLLEHGKFKNYKSSSSGNGICSNYIRTICEDNYGNLWIGTFDGLSKLDLKDEVFTNYIPDRRPGSISDGSIWSLIKDHQGTIWFGTYYGGINYVNPEYEIFEHYRADDTEYLGTSSMLIGQMLEDKNKNLWICTDGGGINMYNPEEKTFEWYQHSTTGNTISHDNTKTLYYDDKSEILWIGTHLGGLNKLDINTGVFSAYFHQASDTTSLPSNVIYDIESYGENLIVATKSGVCFFDKDQGRCIKTLQEEGLNVVVDVLVDHRGILWMSADNGIAAYDIQTEELNFFVQDDSIENGLSNNSVNRIFQDSWNQLWVCTLGGGLDLFNYEKEDFRNFDISNSEILSNVVYSATEYAPGKLLLSTDNGISLFDSNRKSFINYTFDRDLPISSINDAAVYINPEGKVYVGTTKGMLVFNIDELEFKKKTFDLYPYKLYVNGDEVRPSENGNILKESLLYSHNIELNSEHKAFEVKVALTNYISVNKPKIVHKLEGFDKKWKTTNDRNLIGYFNLDPGEYELKVKALGNSSQEIASTSLVISILPPFYQTTGALIFYLLVLGMIVFFIFKAYSSSIRIQESFKYEKKHLDNVNELNQNQLQFFANISHELLTPLTIIIGQLELLFTTYSFTPSVYKKVLSAYRNSTQMQSLVSELLDFRRQESGKMQIGVMEKDIVRLLREAYLQFQSYADTRNIELLLNISEESINLWFDQSQMHKVINNLLSNAFKNTPNGGRVEIILEDLKERVLISVKDNGRGIKQNELDRIFDRFYQVSSINGSGIGLSLAQGIVELHGGKIHVESVPDEGACFLIELQKGKTHFSESQIVNEDITLDKFNPEDIVDNLEPFIKSNIQNSDEEQPNREIKILIVEDNESIRNMLCDIFKEIYEVVSAEDGEIGLEMVAEENPTLVLSDIVMPKLSGIDLCKAIKSNVETCHIPVVLLTARTTNEHYLEGLKLGADDYIKKPFNSKILIARCNNLVTSRMVLQEKYTKEQQASPKILATNKLDNDFLDKCVEIIEKYIDVSEFNVQVFSTEIGMARTKLFNKIKAVTGLTPNEFLMTFRLKKAAFMLKNDYELSIAEISTRTGFSSSRYFSKCFKEKYHRSPLAYRNE